MVEQVMVMEPGDRFLTMDNEGHVRRFVVNEDGTLHEVALWGQSLSPTSEARFLGVVEQRGRDPEAEQ